QAGSRRPPLRRADNRERDVTGQGSHRVGETGCLRQVGRVIYPRSPVFSWRPHEKSVPWCDDWQENAMSTRMMPLVAGNWKMNGLRAGLRELDLLVEGLAQDPADAEVMICPPATLVAEAAARVARTGIAIGGQDCHPLPGGAHTGDISAEMLA